jgi:replicative DNA helicase
MNQAIYDMAVKYRAIGWSVIPLFSYTKIPSAVNWKIYQDRLPTDEEFKDWFVDKNPTGLGLITGKISGVVVLDEDLYKAGGVHVQVKSGMMAQTARGGKHHYFKYIEPIKSSGFREGINVEIKADGGFCVLPPSQVKIDGVLKEYTWVDKCALEDLMEIREDMLSPYRGKGEKIDIMELSGASLGTQHNNLRSIALSAFARFKKSEWVFAEDAIRFAASKFNPPHPLDRVEKMIKDCRKYIETHNKEEIEKEIREEMALPNTINELVEERIADRRLEETAPKTGWPELDRLIKGFIPGHIYTLTGNVNVGKTALAVNFAESLRRQGKRTLYIALEPDVNIVEYLASARLRKTFNTITDAELSLGPEENLIDIFLHRHIESVNDLLRALKGMTKRYDLIIIDHIGYFVRSEHDWLQQQGNVIKELAFLAKKYKTAVMMIAHLRKPGTAKKSKDYVPTQDDISGSGAFKQDSTEVLIAYRPVREDGFGVQFLPEGDLIVSKTKVGPNGSIHLLFPERCAKIWSKEEMDEEPHGADILKGMRENALRQDMQIEAPWDNDHD